MLNPRRSTLILLAVVIVTVLPSLAPAQQGAQAEASREPQELAAIAWTEVRVAADAAMRRLEEIGGGIGDGGELEPLGETLASLQSEYDTVDGRYGAISEATILARRIDDALTAWNGLLTQVSSPLASVDNRYADIQAQLDELTQLGVQWTATLEGLTADADLPAEIAADLSARATAVAEAAADTRSRLQQRSDDVLRLQNALAAMSTEIGQKISYLEQLADNVRRRVLVRDSAPIWNLGSRDVMGLGEEARDALSDRLVVAGQFLVGHPEPTVALFVAFLAFVALGYAMQGPARGWADVSGADALYKMLSRPVSLAMIFTLLSASWFYADLPTSAVDLFLLVTLVPVMRLAPRLLAEKDRVALYGMLAAYAGMRVTSLMTEGSAERRLSLLLLATLALVGLLRFVRRKVEPKPGGNRGWKGTRILHRLAVPMLLAGILANLLGWVRLAWVMTSGTILSAYAAVILWLFAAGASGIAAVLPTTRLGDGLPSLRRKATDVTRVTVIVVRIVAVWIWLDVTLKWFLLRTPAENQLRNLFSLDLGVGGFELTIGDILAALLVLIITPLISRVMRFFFMEEVSPRLALPAGSADGIASLMHYVILTVGALVAATAAGFNTTQLTVVAGALGVGIGFGLQNIVSNFISGLILIFERPIKVGDRISAGATNQVGVVTNIGIRASTVRTFDGSEVVVPNSDLISKEVVNWTLSDMQRRLEMKVNVEYGTELREVIEILRRVAEEHPDVLPEPPSIAVFDGYGESFLAFRLLYWVPMDDLLRIKTEMGLGVDDALRDAAITIAIPRHRVEIAGGPPDTGLAPESDG